MVKFTLKLIYRTYLTLLINLSGVINLKFILENKFCNFNTLINTNFVEY